MRLVTQLKLGHSCMPYPLVIMGPPNTDTSHYHLVPVTKIITDLKSECSFSASSSNEGDWTTLDDF